MLKNKKYFILFTCLCLPIYIFFRNAIDLKDVEQFIKNAGYLAPLIFILSYIAFSLLLFPALFLTLASGALFGPYWGTFYTIIAATVSATTALLIARFIAQDWVARKSGEITKKIIEGVSKEGWYFVAFIRLVPIFPFSLANYAFGLTTIKTIPYTITSFVFMLPATFAYSYIGYLGISTATDSADELASKVLMALAIFACIGIFTKIMKKGTLKKIINNFIKLLVS